MTFAFSAAGTCLLLVVYVSGVSEQELPRTDFLELEVPGMCIGGGSNIQNKELGYILFMRKGKVQSRRNPSGTKRQSLYQELMTINWSLMKLTHH